MKQTPAGRYLRRAGLTPLVRPTRNQVEVTLLPPYGDPEVNIVGEIGTYLAVGAAVIAIGKRIFE